MFGVLGFGNGKLPIYAPHMTRATGSVEGCEGCAGGEEQVRELDVAVPKILSYRKEALL